MSWLLGNLLPTWRVLAASACYWVAMMSPVLAQEEGGRAKQSFAWGLVVLMVVLGMMVTLLPPRRDAEVKGRKE
mgnify:CR=1 FL=1